MIKRLIKKRKTVLLLITIFILLFLYSGNETFAISEDSILFKSTGESIPKDLLIAVTSGTAIIPTGNYMIEEDNQKFQLSEDYSGTITISKDVSIVTIAGYSSDVIHDNTCITMEGGREQAIELTIENLNIKSPFYNKSVIDFSNAGKFDNKLFISGLNKIESTYECAGIHVPNGTKLTIDKVEGLIDAEAQLIAMGFSSGAGIGGASEESGGDITICGGIVTATSNYSGAGIGGGNGGNGGTITVNGGTFTASGVIGAGIGGGWNGDGGIITINEGKVTALGSSGSGIGGGDGGDGGIITISEGTVTATGAEAGIGGDSVGTITISGGTITAEADAVAIGGDRGIINISGGTVTATGDTGIGSRG